MAGTLIITHQKFLVCEGMEDVALAREMRRRGLIPEMHIEPTGKPVGVGNGVDGIKDYLIGLAALPDFDRITSLGILADNDLTPSTLERIREQLIEANKNAQVDSRFSVPDVGELRGDNAAVQVSIILSPGDGTTGCLETLLCRVLERQKPDTMACVKSLIHCSGIAADGSAWSKSKIEKAIVRSALAVLVRRNPAIALSNLWNEDDTLVPVESPEFDPLIRALNAV